VVGLGADGRGDELLVRHLLHSRYVDADAAELVGLGQSAQLAAHAGPPHGEPEGAVGSFPSRAVSWLSQVPRWRLGTPDGLPSPALWLALAAPRADPARAAGAEPAEQPVGPHHGGFVDFERLHDVHPSPVR
jgi:hypothetical protein